MKAMLKKTLALLVVIASLISLLPQIAIPSLAANPSGTCGENLTWELDTETGVLTISGTGEMYDYTFGENPWGLTWRSIKEVQILDGVTSVGPYAFLALYSLSSITLPKSITSIGAGAFYLCTALSSVTIPENVVSIGSSAFYRCTALTEFAVSEANSNYASDTYGVLFSKDKTKLIQCPAGYVGSYTIPDSVTHIGDSAFFYCTSLIDVSIPENVVSIGSSAFYRCTALTEFAVSEANSNYASDTYGVLFSKDKTKLIQCPAGYVGSYTIPDGVNHIEGSAFSYCASLTHVTISDDVYYVGSSAFSDCTALKSVSISDSVSYIGTNAFQNCSALTSVTIPYGVTLINSSPFQGCTSLTEIVVSDKNDFYSSDVHGVLFDKNKTELLQCPGGYIGSYTIPDGVTCIEYGAFYGCSSLTSVTIPDSVFSIGAFAFNFCSSLTNVTIPDSITSIESSIFSGCTALTSVTIPNSVTSIGYGAFADCTSLISVVIPDRVTDIGFNAFSGCSALTKITIPGSVTSIRGGAFSDCSALTGIYVSGANAYYANDVHGILFNKDKTELIQCPGGYTGKYVIPDSVVYIGDSAFYGCTYLTSVTVPKSVISIDGYAFYNCIGLSDVYFAGNAPQIGDGLFYCYAEDEPYSEKILPDLILYYKDGKEGWTTPTWNGYPTACKPFADIYENNYFYQPVLWAIENNITNGTSENTFSPSDACTRGQIVTFLWRACGSPEPTQTETAFTDLKPSAFYYKAVLWAVENGITSGTSATTFSPNDSCTRGQVATFLWRAEGKPTPEASSNPFTDVISGTFCYKAVLWAVENGITNGMGNGLFAPNDSCTRGQIVTFLYRALNESGN